MLTPYSRQCPECKTLYPRGDVSFSEIEDNGKCLACQHINDEAYLEEMRNVERHNDLTERYI